MFVTLNDILIVRVYSTNCIFVSATVAKDFNILWTLDTSLTYYTINLLSMMA